MWGLQLERGKEEQLIGRPFAYIHGSLDLTHSIEKQSMATTIITTQKYNCENSVELKLFNIFKIKLISNEIKEVKTVKDD